jgi:hypothetical protein
MAAEGARDTPSGKPARRSERDDLRPAPSTTAPCAAQDRDSRERWAELPTGRSAVKDQLLAEACTAGSTGDLAFLVGAGISVPSGLPTSAQIIGTCVEQLLQRAPGNLSCRAVFPEGYGQRVRLEYFCHLLSHIKETIRLSPLRLLAGGQPSRFHYFLAECAKAGLTRVIITTNFDLLIERAMDDLGVPYRLLHREQDLARFQVEDSGTTLIKIHGTLDAESGEPAPGILADIHSVGQGFPEQRTRVLREVARRYHLLVLGYSGRDFFGAMPTLISGEPRPVFWVNHARTGEKTNALVRNWVTNATKGVYADADTGEVVEALACRLGIAAPHVCVARPASGFGFADGLSHHEQPFALAYLYAQDARCDNRVAHRSFAECESLLKEDPAADPQVLGRLYLQWARTLERAGRTPSAYQHGVSILQEAEGLLQGEARLVAEVRVLRYEMEFCLTFLMGGSGVQYLPLMEMLTAECMACGDLSILAKAYCAEARMFMNAVEPRVIGYTQALECYELAAGLLERVGAQEALYMVEWECFRLSTALKEGGRAARAITAMLRAALLVADSPEADEVRTIAQYISLFLNKEEYQSQNDYVQGQIARLGFHL